MKNVKISNYKHLFFDLDNTLWDFDATSHEAFLDMYNSFDLKKDGVITIDNFYLSYKTHSAHLWNLYRTYDIEKEVLIWLRFYLALKDFGCINQPLAIKLGYYYIDFIAQHSLFCEGVPSVLDKLSKSYNLHIITNGFEEAQFPKLKNTGLGNYFKTITTCEKSGFRKPDKRMFEFALSLAGAKANESLMIGDDEQADVDLAINAGVDCVKVNKNVEKLKNSRATYCYSSLLEFVVEK